MHAYSSPEIRRWYLRARIALRAACALALLACAVAPALCALGVDPACELLYRASPALAQRLRPERLRCANGGVELRVESVERIGDEIDAVFAMRDLEGDRLNADSDPYDYIAVLGRGGPMDFAPDMLAFDEASRTLRLPIRIANWDGARVAGKISLSLRRVYAATQYCESPLRVDLSALGPAKPAPMREPIRGCNPAHPESYEVHLVPGLLCTPLEGVDVTAAGYVDGKLRLQFHFADSRITPATGDVCLESANRETVHWFDSFSFDAPDGGCYEEFLFNISPEDAPAYQIRANLLRYTEIIEGPWTLTFQT